MTQPVQTGPCEAWCDAEDITNCGCTVGDNVDLKAAAAAASEVLFELSGHRFTGICEQTVQPPGDGSCWARLPYSLPYDYSRVGSALWYTHQCGCQRVSFVRLAGYPVQSITEVLIDGDVVPPDGYELRYDNELVRLADADGHARSWPCCQRMDIREPGPGTFFITYQFGTPPPITGVSAAAQLACEIAKACTPDTECKVPKGAVRISRQGITVDTQAMGLWLIGSVRTGMQLVDAFMSVYGSPRRQQKVALMVPEQPPWPVRVP